jgi:hypothetical protein
MGGLLWVIDTLSLGMQGITGIVSVSAGVGCPLPDTTGVQ